VSELSRFFAKSYGRRRRKPSLCKASLLTGKLAGNFIIFGDPAARATRKPPETLTFYFNSLNVRTKN
jgi:hypothetical protein